MTPLNKSTPPGNILNWIAALACAACGIGLCRVVYVFSELTEGFSGHIFPFAARVVMIVGPAGWLLFSLVFTLLIIRFRRSSLGSIFAIAFLSIAIAVGCALLFSSINCPYSNIRVSLRTTATAGQADRI